MRGQMAFSWARELSAVTFVKVCWQFRMQWWTIPGYAILIYSDYSNCLISFLRYRQVPLGIFLCVVIWLVSLLSSAPYGILGHIYQSSPDGRISCRVNWPPNDHLLFRRTWIYLQLTLGFAIPLTVIVVFNVLLLRRVHLLVSVPGTTTATVTSSDVHARRSRMSWTMTRTVLAVVVIFVVCQVPYHVVEIVSLCVAERVLLGDGGWPGRNKWQVFLYFNVASQILVFVSSCCNPIIYGIFNKNYRKLKRFLCMLNCPTISINQVKEW